MPPVCRVRCIPTCSAIRAEATLSCLTSAVIRPGSSSAAAATIALPIPRPRCSGATVQDNFQAPSERSARTLPTGAPPASATRTRRFGSARLLASQDMCSSLEISAVLWLACLLAESLRQRRSRSASSCVAGRNTYCSGFGGLTRVTARAQVLSFVPMNRGHYPTPE